MYSKIMVPVDLAHKEGLDKALTTAADLAKHYGASLTYVGVTVTTPTSIAHNPAEYEKKLAEYTAYRGREAGLEIGHRTITSGDPIRDLDDVLKREIEENGYDLVVMATHVPGFRDYIFNSNAGYLTTHTNVSVFAVR